MADHFQPVAMADCCYCPGPCWPHKIVQQSTGPLRPLVDSRVEGGRRSRLHLENVKTNSVSFRMDSAIRIVYPSIWCSPRFYFVPTLGGPKSSSCTAPAPLNIAILPPPTSHFPRRLQHHEAPGPPNPDVCPSSLLLLPNNPSQGRQVTHLLAFRGVTSFTSSPPLPPLCFDTFT